MIDLPAGSMRRPGIVLLLLILIFGGVMSVFTLTRMYELKTSILDLGLNTQSFWNLMQGNGFVSTTSHPFVEYSVFGVHITPNYFLLLPFYALFPFPEIFQLIQVWLYALSALPVFMAARALGSKEREALLWTAFFLINPFLINAAIWDFHETCLSTFFMAWLLWAITTKRRYAFILFSILLLMCKEHYGLSVAGAGVVWFLLMGERRLGAIVASAGLIYSAVAVLYLVPLFNPTGEHLLTGGGGGSMNRFGWLLDPLNHRSEIAQMIPSLLWYVFLLFAPLIGLPLLGIMWLLPAASDLAVNSVSMSGFQRSLLAYHSAPIIPCLILAAVAGFQRVKKMKQQQVRPHIVMLATMLLSTVIGWTSAPLPFPGMRNGWELSSPRLDYAAADHQAIAEIRQRLNADTQLATDSNLGVLFAHRRFLYPFPQPLEKLNAVVLRLQAPYKDAPDQPPPADALENILIQPEWGVTYWNPPWLLIERTPAQRLNVTEEVRNAWQQFLRQGGGRMEPP